MNQKLGTEKGFTLVEAIVAMGVIAVGFVGSLVLLSKSAAQASALKDRVVAAHLAEEGIEVIRNIRDTNWLSSSPDWLRGLIEPPDVPVGTSVTGIVDYNDIFLDSNNITDSKKCLSWNGTFYFHDPSCNTPFKRQIVLTKKTDVISGTNVNYLEVKSVVEWTEKGFSKSITVIDHLYDWK